jgi:hypothetical protein
MPVAIARKEGYDQVLAVNVNRFVLQEVRDFKNRPLVIFRGIECALNAGEDKKEKAELTINVTDATTPFSFLKQKELIELGDLAVRGNIKALEAFFRPGFCLSRKPVVCEAEKAVDPGSW